MMEGRKTTRELFVVLLPTLECNLACDYCFEDHPSGRWSLAQTEHVVAEILKLSREEGIRRLQLHWQGGEALSMGTAYWSRVLSMAQSAGAHEAIEVDQSMQTNLTLYSSRMAPVIEKYLGGRIGTSFEDAHGRHFPSEDGERFRRTWARAFDRARKDGLEVGVLSLITPEVLEQGASGYLDRLREVWGIRQLRFTLPFTADSRGDVSARGYWIDPVRAGAFLRDAYHWWIDHGRDEAIEIRPFGFLEAQIGSRETPEPGLCLFSCNCAEVGLSIATDGRVVLCDSLLASKTLEPYGNVFSESLLDIYRGEGRCDALRRCGALVGSECIGCRYLALCFGGCMARTRAETDGETRLFHYCESYRALYGSIEEAIHGPSNEAH